MLYVKILLLALIFLLPAAPADAQINILPRKVVLEPRERSAEVTILNMTDKASLYRIALVSYRQKNDGTYETLEAPLDTAFDPEAIVRVSPRQFQLPANGRQKIRLSLRKPADLPDGEYRFHLMVKYFEGEEASDAAPNRGVGINMRMNISLSIPVIIRHGSNLSASAKITDARYAPPSQSTQYKHALRTNIARQGNISTTGTVSIHRGTELVGVINNLNIFTEADHRVVNIPLQQDPRGKGTLRITYADDNGKVWDETTFTP